MTITNERHVDTDRAGDTKGGGNFPTLMDMMNKKVVRNTPFNEADLIVNAQYTLIDSSNFPNTIAVGVTSEETDGGYQAAALPGAVGTAAITAIMDSDGEITNQVDIRNSVTHDPVLVDSREVYGLLQTASAVSDGTAVGASGSENLQVSFVTKDASNALQLVALDETIEIALPKLRALRHELAYSKQTYRSKADIIVPDEVIEPTVRKYIVISPYIATEVIQISTGDGASSGASTVTGDTISSIGVDANAFNDDNRTRIRVNGSQCSKPSEAIWSSSTSLNFTFPLDIDDTFEIEVA